MSGDQQNGHRLSRGDSKPLVELFIKCAPSDREQKGACLIDQQWFMVFYILVQRGAIELRLTPVCLDYPPYNYVQLNAARRLPAAWVEQGSHEGEDLSNFVASTTDELEFLMEKFNVSNMHSPRQSEDAVLAERAFEDVYKNTMHFIKLGHAKPLLAALRRLNEFLGSSKSRYLINDEISYPDCLLMPKLQHMRVALLAYHSWELPKEYSYIWTYLRQMYKTTAFKISCPADRDILMHYNVRQPLPKEIHVNSMGTEKLGELKE